MNFKFIKQVMEDVNQVGILKESFTVVASNDEMANLCESATHVLANVIDKLKNKKEDWTKDLILNLGSILFLADQTNRQTIIDAMKGGEKTLMATLQRAGEGRAANTLLAKIAQKYGMGAVKGAANDVQKAKTDDAFRKDLIQKYTKIMDLIGRVQTGSTGSAGAAGGAGEQGVDISKWFK